MTIRPGSAWGEVVTTPGGLAVVADDAGLGRWLQAGGAGAVRVLAGDLVRTVGGASHGATSRRYPLDTLRVVVDRDEAGAVIAVAHVVVRRAGRLGWWRGPIWAAMNVSRLGQWDVAPRAHPNDAKVDVVAVAPTMTGRQRWQAMRRLPAGTHVPHPAIAVSRGAVATWEATAPRTVFVDGVAVGRARHVTVTVIPDAVTVHV